MYPFLRATMPAILLATTIGLSACDNNTETVNTNEPPATATVSKTAAELITVSQPRIRATPPGQTVTGAFMTLVVHLHRNLNQKQYIFAFQIAPVTAVKLLDSITSSRIR
ncbi:MAG: hypothetical protein QNK19_09660 [Xanthomonadales bacterium]|nr:hypothetical protein [Xanthomonadales bacterium]